MIIWLSYHPYVQRLMLLAIFIASSINFSKSVTLRALTFILNESLLLISHHLFVQTRSYGLMIHALIWIRTFFRLVLIVWLWAMKQVSCSPSFLSLASEIGSDQPTDQQTNTSSRRDAYTQLKIWLSFLIFPFSVPETINWWFVDHRFWIASSIHSFPVFLFPKPNTEASQTVSLAFPLYISSTWTNTANHMFWARSTY